MSAGIRSGVNWMRLNVAVDDVGEGADEHRLAQAGHAFEQRVAVGDQADQRLPDEVVLADDDALDLAFDGGRQLGELLDCYFGRARRLRETASTSAAPTG